MSLTNATGSLSRSFSEVRNVMDNVQFIVDEVQEAADSATEAQKNFEDSRIRTKSLLENGICQDPSKTTVADETIAVMTNVLDDIGDWSLLVEESLGDIQSTLERAEQTYVEDVYSGIDIVEDYASISWIMITMLIFAPILLIGLLLAVFGLNLKPFFCIQGWVILPLFMMSLALSIFISCVCAIALVINSDTCIGSVTGDPEGLVKVLIQYDMLDVPYKELLDHYIFEACTNQPEMIELVDYLLDQTIYYHEQFMTSVQSLSVPETIVLLERQCDNGISLNETVSTLVSFTTVTEALIPIAQNAKNVIDCPTVFGIYQEFTHDFLCESLPLTFGWIFWCVVLYSFFGMLVFTFRGALFPSVPFDSYGEFKNETYDWDDDDVGANYENDRNDKDKVAPSRKGKDDYGEDNDNDSGRQSQFTKGTLAKTGYEVDESLTLDPTYSTSTDSVPYNDEQTNFAREASERRSSSSATPNMQLYSV